MKKLFTFIFACLCAITMMAEEETQVNLNFVGNSEYYLPSKKNSTFTMKSKDSVVINLNAGDITIPDIVFDKSALSMTVKSFTIKGLDYAVVVGEKMEFSCTTKNFSATTKDEEGNEKTITGSSLKVSGALMTGDLSLQLTFKYDNTNITYNIEGYWTKENAWELVGAGTKDNPFRILEAEDFLSMAKNYDAESNTGKGQYFHMMNDIDFGGTEENPVQFPAIGKNADLSIANIKGGFDGIFDGDNHIISGIYHTKVSMDAAGKYNGLFGFTDKDAVIKNIIIGEENHLCGYNYVGAIVSMNQGTIENCVNYADITAANFGAAGICGFMVNGNGTINYCQNYGNIAAQTYASGICGGSQSGKSLTTYNYLIENCSNDGSLSTTNGLGSAGIAGSYSGAIKKCTNYGDADDTKGTAKSRQYTAGIVACITYATAIEDCENYGTISGVNNVGGIVGNIMKGDSTAFTIKNCANYAPVKNIGNNVAGIIGNSARNGGLVSVVDCANNGKVSSTGTKTLLGNIRGSETITIGTGNTIAANLDRLPLDTDDITGIADITVKADTIADGKFVKNGKLVIVKNGKAFNALGIAQ